MLNHRRIRADTPGDQAVCSCTVPGFMYRTVVDNGLPVQLYGIVIAIHTGPDVLRSFAHRVRFGRCMAQFEITVYGAFTNFLRNFSSLPSFDSWMTQQALDATDDDHDQHQQCHELEQPGGE